MEMQAEAEAGLMAMEMDGLIQYAEEESDSEGTEDSEVSDESGPIEEEAEEAPEAQEIERPGVIVEEDGETDEIFPEEEELMMPGMVQRQKIAFII